MSCTATASESKLLTLPDELLLKIISHHLTMPQPAPRIILSSPFTADPAILKLTCKRLNILVQDVETRQREPLTMFISNPVDFVRFYDECGPNSTLSRVRRIVFTDTGLADPTMQDTLREGEIRQAWAQSIPALIDGLINCVKTANTPLLPRLQEIAIWPENRCRIRPTSPKSSLGIGSSVKSELPQDLIVALFEALTPLCRLLNVRLTVLTPSGASHLTIRDMPHVLDFTCPITALPTFLHSPRSANHLSQRENWTLTVHQMSLADIVKALRRFLHHLNRRVLAWSSTSPSDGPSFCARIKVQYSPGEMEAEDGRELVHLVRQEMVMAGLGCSRVSTDLETQVLIDIG